MPLSSEGFQLTVESLYTRIKINFCKIKETVLNDCMRFKEDFSSIKVAKENFIKNFNLMFWSGTQENKPFEIFFCFQRNLLYPYHQYEQE